jgi:hypothetical protein
MKIKQKKITGKLVNNFPIPSIQKINLLPFLKTNIKLHIIIYKEIQWKIFGKYFKLKLHMDFNLFMLKISLSITLRLCLKISAKMAIISYNSEDILQN